MANQEPEDEAFPPNKPVLDLTTIRKRDKGVFEFNGLLYKVQFSNVMEALRRVSTHGGAKIRGKPTVHFDPEVQRGVSIATIIKMRQWNKGMLVLVDRDRLYMWGMTYGGTWFLCPGCPVAIRGARNIGFDENYAGKNFPIKFGIKNLMNTFAAAARDSTRRVFIPQYIAPEHFVILATHFCEPARYNRVEGMMKRSMERDNSDGLIEYSPEQLRSLAQNWSVLSDLWRAAGDNRAWNIRPGLGAYLGLEDYDQAEETLHLLCPPSPPSPN